MQLMIWGTLLFIPAAIFSPSAALHWWRAWIFVLASAAAAIVMMLAVFPQRQDLLEERFKPPIQQGQPLADRIVLLSFLAAFCGVIAFIPIDVFRFRLFAKPNILVSSLGLVLYFAGWVLVSLALRDNTFAAPVVRHQTERQHTVVDTGLYAFVRHPMYAGFVPLMVGAPLWLESYGAVLAAAFPMLLLMARIAIEERLLRRELQGYDAYTRKVRSRLIPGIW
jgi:protein-S-isoprenylcysteine O-methyltransferase Ste14